MSRRLIEGRGKERQSVSPRPSNWDGDEFLLLLAARLLIAVSFNMFHGAQWYCFGRRIRDIDTREESDGIPPASRNGRSTFRCFSLGLWLLGKRFALKTALGSFVLPLFVLLTSHW